MQEGSLRQTTKAVEMLLPIWDVDTGIRNRRTAMQHLTAAHVNSNMGHIRGIIGSYKEDQIPGFGIGRRYWGTYIVQTLRRGSSDTPSAMIDDPANKTAAIKTGFWGTAAPDIRVAQILFPLCNHGGECFILQSFRWNFIVGWWHQC